MSDPEFLTVEDVLALHEHALSEHGGMSGVRDRGLLESAVAVPMATFGGDYLHAGLFEMAAAYAYHIAQNQPFLDGNKRAAIGAALVFLHLNEVDIPESTDELYAAMIEIAERRSTKEDLAGTLRRLGDFPRGDFSDS